jgi:hypothetical protein
MIIDLDALLSRKDNRYTFTKASMHAVDKIANMTHYPDNDKKWKVVPNILQLMLEEKVKFEHMDDYLE